MANKKSKTATESIALTDAEQDLVFMALQNLQGDVQKLEKTASSLKADGAAREGAKFFNVIDELKQKFLTAPDGGESGEDEEE